MTRPTRRTITKLTAALSAPLLTGLLVGCSGDSGGDYDTAVLSSVTDQKSADQFCVNAMHAGNADDIRSVYTKLRGQDLQGEPKLAAESGFSQDNVECDITGGEKHFLVSFSSGRDAGPADGATATKNGVTVSADMNSMGPDVQSALDDFAKNVRAQ